MSEARMVVAEAATEREAAREEDGRNLRDGGPGRRRGRRLVAGNMEERGESDKRWFGRVAMR
jgi:hypothetical protein